MQCSILDPDCLRGFVRPISKGDHEDGPRDRGALFPTIVPNVEFWRRGRWFRTRRLSRCGWRGLHNHNIRRCLDRAIVAHVRGKEVRAPTGPMEAWPGALRPWCVAKGRDWGQRRQGGFRRERADGIQRAWPLRESAQADQRQKQGAGKVFHAVSASHRSG